MTGRTQRFEQGERIEVEKGSMLSLQVAGQSLTWGRCRPGWRWSHHVGPMLELERCPVHHRLILLEGRLGVLHADGTTRTLASGDVEEVLPGHDAWVEGDEDVVFLDAPVQ